VNLKLEVKEIRWLNNKTINVIFDVLTKDFTFEPGNHINIVLPNKNSRPYSIASSSNNPEEITVVVSAEHNGEGADYLKSLSVGDMVKAVGPFGKFRLKKHFSSNLLFVTTGTGIAPIISMLYKLSEENYDGKITLLFGLRNEESIYLKDVLEGFKSSFSDFNYSYCLSKPNNSWDGNKGYVSEFIDVKDVNNTQVYLCGHREMVSTAKEKLLSIGIKEENIIY